MGAETQLTCERCRAEIASQALFCPMCGLPRAAREGDTMLGKIVAERYLVKERLGQGGSGTIYLAEHITVKRKLAVKVYHHELSRDDLATERFRREATTVAEIDNEHIVEVLDFGRLEDGRLFLAMELLDGETLAVAIRRERHLPIDKIVDVLTQVGEALMEAHAMGYIHRDLRPGNIFLSRRRGRQGFVKILDFGLSKLVQREGSEAANTGLAMTFGDPCYMSPEQARGDLADRRADIYALGVMAYEMLTGKPPFVGKKVFEVLTQHLEKKAEPPSKVRSDVPPWLDSLVMRALAKKPEDRFITVYRLIEAIREGKATGKIMDDITSRSMPPIEPEPPAPRRRDETTDVVAPLPAPANTSSPSASKRVAMAAQSNQPAGRSSGWYEDGEKLSDTDAELVPARLRRGLFIALGILAAGVAGLAVVVLMSRPKAVAAVTPDAAPRVEIVAEPTPAPPAPAPHPTPVVEPAPTPTATRPPEPTPAPAVKPPTPKPASAPDSAAKPPAVVKTPKAPVRAPEKPVDRNAPPVFNFRPRPAEPIAQEATDDDGTEKDDSGDEQPQPKPAAPPPTTEAGQADFYIKLAQNALRAGDTTAATENFNKARMYDPSNPDAIAGLGQVAIKRGDYTEAIVHLDAASRLAPTSARIHVLRGQAYLGAGNRAAAETAFKRALKISPDNKAAAEGLRQATGE